MTNQCGPAGSRFAGPVDCGFAPVAPAPPSSKQLAPKPATAVSAQMYTSTSVAVVPSQSTVNLTVAVSARSNRNIMQGPAEPKASATSGHTAALFGLTGTTVMRVAAPPTAGTRDEILGAVCQLLDAAHWLPVVVTVGVVSATVSPGTYVTLMPAIVHGPVPAGASTVNRSAVFVRIVTRLAAGPVTATVATSNFKSAVDEIVTVSPACGVVEDSAPLNEVGITVIVAVSETPPAVATSFACPGPTASTRKL